MVVLNFPKKNEIICDESTVTFLDLKIEINKNEHAIKRHFEYDNSSDLAKEIIEELESDLSGKYAGKKANPITF